MTESRTGVVTLAIILTLSLSQGAPAQDAALSLEFDPKTEVIPEPRQKEQAEALILFTAAIGGFGITSESFDRPVDIVHDSDGGYYVLDAGNSRVQKFSNRDRFEFEWGSYGSREGRFKDPQSIAIDHKGNVYVVDTRNDRIQKFDPEGNFILAWGNLGSAQGRFKGPVDITFDGNGDVYVLDSGNDRIQKFSVNGAFIEEWGRFRGGREGDYTRLVSIAWADDRFGYLYLLGEGASDGACLVQILRLRGGRREVEESWRPEIPEEDGGKCSPGRLEIDNREDYVYILDDKNSVLRRFTKDGRYIDSVWRIEVALASPLGFSIREDRQEIWVADTGNNLVQRFSLR